MRSVHRKFFFQKETCRTIYTDDFSKIFKEMDYSVQRLQFLDLTDATENDQSLIERVLFSSSQVLEVPWCTGGRSGADENQAEQEWGNSSFPGDVEPRQDLQTNQISTSHQDGENGSEQCGGEGSEEGNQTEHQEPAAPQQDQMPRQGGIFPGHPPTSLPHQPVFQMYQMVPSLSNVYVSNVTANVNVHAPYVQPIPTHYGHQMPPQQQQQPPQQMYPHGPPEGEQGSRNRRQRQKTDKKREGPFVPANEVMSPSLENHPPPQFPNIHPMQPYYIPGAPGAPVYMQHAVLPVYPSPMFNPYGHSPGPIVYPPSNNIEPGNDEYHENVQQNFHQAGPEMVVVGCAIRQENATERRGLDNNENGNYPVEEQRGGEQVGQDSTLFKPIGETVQFSSENGEGQPEQPFVPHQNGEHIEKANNKGETVTANNNYYEVKEKTLEVEKAGNGTAEGPGQAPLQEQTVQFTGVNSRKADTTCFSSDVVKVPKKANGGADVNNVDSISVNSSSSAAEWGNEETGGHVPVPHTESNKTKLNNSANVQVMNVQESPIPASQNSEFPLIGQMAKSTRQTPSFASPEPEPKTEQPVASPGPSQTVTPSSGGKSWASLFSRSEQLSATPMSDNRGRPLARVHPYHEAENSSPGVAGVTPPTPVTTGVQQPERVPSVKANGPLSRDSVPNSNFLNDPYLYNLGVFLCSYELEHKIVSLQPRGLTNRSNWCYVNAILQSLIACPPFYNLLKALPLRPSKKENKQTLIMDALVEYVNEFSLLPANARIGKREKSARNKEESNVVEILAGSAFEPSGIYRILDKVRGESSFNVEGRQEDAEEFLSCLLNGLNDEMFELMKIVDANNRMGLSNGDANGSLGDNADEDESEWNVMGPKNKSSVTRRAVCGKTPISDIFRGQFRSRVQRAGDQSTDTVQPFFTLQLDIEKASSVKDALELFMGRDPLEGVTCSRTHQEVEAWTQTTLEDLPLVLILHLKCYDYKSDACSKIIKSVDFQVDLKIDAKLLSNRNKYTAKQRNYKLVAVVYHDGKEASKGHYVTDAYHVGYGCWLRYDDMVVRSVPESHVLKPRAPRVPYLLYYRRADTIGPTK